jgi:ApaG protein
VTEWLFPYVETTRSITVRASVSYFAEQSEPQHERWFWSYHIRIENDGDMTVQLLTRHWDIVDARGGHHVVDGEGVVGEQPILHPGDVFDYVSGCPLTTQTGRMEGYYTVCAEDGSTFNIDIPALTLRLPVAA